MKQVYFIFEKFVRTEETVEMKGYVSKFFRYPVQDAMLFLSIILACFFLLLFSVSSERLQKYSNSKLPYDNAVEFAILEYYGNGPQPSEWTEFFEKQDEFVLLCRANRKKQGYTYCPSDNIFVLISQNEPFQFAISGVSFEECKKVQNAVVLGKGWIPYLEKDGQNYFFEYSGVDLSVSGFLQDYAWEGDSSDYSAFIIWETLTGQAKLALQKEIKNNSVIVLSNKFDISEITNRFQSELALVYEKRNKLTLAEAIERPLTDEELESCKAKFLARNLKERNHPEDVSWYSGYWRITLPIGILFSFFSCVHIISVWLQRRRREYTIREVFGYTRNKLMMLVIGELVRYIVVALGIVMVIAFSIFPYYRESIFATARLLVIMAIGAFVVVVLCLISIWRNVARMTTQINEE